MPLTVLHAKSVTVADATTTAIARPSDWNSAHNITFTPAASELQDILQAGSGVTRTTDANGITFKLDDLPYQWDPYFPQSKGTSAFVPGVGTWYVDPVLLPYGLSGGRINILMSNATGPHFTYGASTLGSVSTGGGTVTWSIYNRVGVYSLHSDGTHLVSVFTANHDWGFGRTFTEYCTATSNSIRVTVTDNLTYVGAIDRSGGSSGSTLSTVIQVSTATTSFQITKLTHTISNLVTGVVAVPLPIGTYLPAGNYWFAFMHSSASASSTDAKSAYVAGTLFGGTVNRAVIANQIVGSYKQFGASASASTTNLVPGAGYYVNISSAAPATMALSDIVNYATNPRVVWNYVRDNLT